MAMEQTDSIKTVRPAGCLSTCKQAAALVLVLAALVFSFIMGGIYLDIAQSLSTEPVYEVSPEKVHPSMEGKMVKMRVTELVAEGGPLVDETFGLRMENTIAMHRFYQSDEKGRLRVSYHKLHGIRDASFHAPTVRAGDFVLRAGENFWEDLGYEYINPDELTLPPAWENHVVSRTKHDITLRTDDISNLAIPHVDFCYTRVASPWHGVRHMVGRQRGNVLDITGKNCGLVRGEEEFRRWTRARPAIGMLLMGPWEYCFWILGLQGVITLCLLPAVLILQKRGYLRAAIVAALLGIELCSLVAIGWLLIPLEGHTILSRTYTVLPFLAAIPLLYFALRNRTNPSR